MQQSVPLSEMIKDPTKKMIIDDRRYDLAFSIQLSTEENYRSNNKNFFGSYAHIRKTLDYNYHSNYTEDRQRIQDSIIEEMFETMMISMHRGVCTTSTEQWIVFTAGAMGAGKSHTIKQLVKKGRIPLREFLYVDPDEIRRRIPEFMVYVDNCPEVAGEKTKKEAGYISEILSLAGLHAGKNVMVDGSLRDSDWYEKYFARLRTEFPLVRISILHICAPREAVLERAARRAEETGRVIPQHILKMSLEQVPKSVKILAPLADFFCELNNSPGTDDIEILTKGMDWNNFRRGWLQTFELTLKMRKPWISQLKLVLKEIVDASVMAIKSVPQMRRDVRPF